MTEETIAAKVAWLRGRLSALDVRTTLPNGDVLDGHIHLETVPMGDGGGYTRTVTLEALATAILEIEEEVAPKKGGFLAGAKLDNDVLATLKDRVGPRVADKLDHFRKKGLM